MLAAATAVLSPPPAAAGAPCGGGSLDVLFLFDTTGSMGGVIASAQQGATAIMDRIAANVTDVRFGVANYKDYPGWYSYPGYSNQYGDLGDYPWRLDQGLTSDRPTVQAAIDGLSASGGYDTPESLTRAVSEASGLAWRADATRIVVLFADAAPHDEDFHGEDYGGDPGPDALAQTADDLDFQGEVARAASSGLQYAVVDSSWDAGGFPGSGDGTPAFRHLANATSGAYAVLAGDFVEQVVDLVLGLGGTSAHFAEAYDLAFSLDGGAWGGVELTKINHRVAPAGSAGSYASRTVAAGPLTIHADVLSAAADGSGASATASAGLLGLRVELGGSEILGADLVEASSRSEAAPGAPTTASGSARIVGLRVNGAPFLPNMGGQTIPLPGGSLAIDEREPSPTGLAVRALHLRLAGPNGSLDLVLAAAATAAVCGAGEVPPPPPTQEPALVVRLPKELPLP